MFWKDWTGNLNAYREGGIGAQSRPMSTQAIIVTFAKNIHHVAKHTVADSCIGYHI